MVILASIPNSKLQTRMGVGSFIIQIQNKKGMMSYGQTNTR
jgi:hypothetical protein